MFLISFAVTNNADVLSLEYLPLLLLRTAVDVKLGLLTYLLTYSMEQSPS